MKALNMMMMVAEFGKKIAKYLEGIDGADSFDHAKQIGQKAFGYIDAMNDMTNLMICTENNDFTGQMDDLMSEMIAQIYNALAIAADKFNEPENKISELREKRDFYRR